MFNKKISSSGGKARAKIQKQETKDRIDEYNKNPNICLNCNSPILAPYSKPLRDTKVKKFCCLSCATSFNNRGKIKNPKGNNGQNNKATIIDNLSDEQIIDAFNTSDNLKEFSLKLGYKTAVQKNNKSMIKRLELLNLDIEEIIYKEKKKIIYEQTKEDIFERRSNWQSARSAIQRDARKIYQNSDKPKKCIVCGYDKHYEVAHIKAVSEFNDDTFISEINDINNLIALCPNHHWEYDNIGLDISMYIDKKVEVEIDLNSDNEVLI